MVKIGSRYYLTGIQLAILIATAMNIKSKSMEKLLVGIENKQYICDKESFERMLKLLKEKNEKN